MASTSASDKNEFELVEIDGSVLEGGGQILRLATVCSALLKKPIRVTKIRAGRDKPGLRPQHLCGLQLVRDLCGGKLTGDFVGSKEIKFIPNKLIAGDFLADTKTAGSVGLLIQVSLPCLIFSPGQCKVVLKGGTDADFAPPMDFLLEILKPALAHFGLDFQCEIVRRGYYPKGGGEVRLVTKPIGELKSINFEARGNLVKIDGKSWIAGSVPKHVVERISTAARQILRKSIQGSVTTQISEVQETKQTAFGDGTAYTSNGFRLSGSALGKRGVPAEKVGETAAEMLVNNLQHEECVDEYLQDQLLIFMALANGVSKIRTGPLTLHTKTAIHVIELLTNAKFEVEELGNGGRIIRCQGIGYKI